MFHKLFWIDIFLIILTGLGLIYLYTINQITLVYSLVIFFIYVLSKIVGYLILPYNKFDKFINFLSDTSKISNISGFEIFKTILVVLLYIGFIFINPAIWIIESVLVIVMRIWGLTYIKSQKGI